VPRACARRARQKQSSSPPTIFESSFYFKRGSVPPRCPLGSAILREFFLRNGSN
jgi:hypothetical protein